MCHIKPQNCTKWQILIIAPPPFPFTWPCLFLPLYQTIPSIFITTSSAVHLHSPFLLPWKSSAIPEIHKKVTQGMPFLFTVSVHHIGIELCGLYRAFRNCCRTLPMGRTGWGCWRVRVSFPLPPFFLLPQSTILCWIGGGHLRWALWCW